MKKNNSIDQLLTFYTEEIQILAEEARKLITGLLSDIHEEADFSAKLIGYGFGPGYKHSICTIILSKKGIKIGLFKATEFPDPQKLLEGTGKVHKYVAITDKKELNNPALKTLLKEADKAYRKRVA